MITAFFVNWQMEKFLQQHCMKNEDFRVILDASPASKGHALIIPKEHYANLYELDDDKAAKVYGAG